MNSNTKSSAIGKTAQQNYPGLPTANQSLLLEKLHARRSTPDSEALASSDDEIDQHRQEYQPPAPTMHKPTRRASWLNDTTQPLSQPRKGSFASTSMSPSTSHPSTPSAESGTWGTHVSTSGAGIGRGHPGTNSFPWGTGIWNSEARKEPPSRLTEVLPSPISAGPSNSSGNIPQSSSMNRDIGPETAIPFAIPLHPTPKTYRSQSYSVGQLDQDSTSTGATPATAQVFNGRGRALPHSGLQHRPSRPSMLSEMSNDGAGLGKVKEVDDDEDNSPNGSTKGTKIQLDQAKAIEELARENAILRQQNLNNSRLRSRSSTSTSAAIGTYPVANSYIRDSLPEESDYAIDEMDEISELQDLNNRGLLGRRLSEYGPGHLSRASAAYTALENRKLESVKKAFWQSSLGFGGLADIPQSRRHSFADIPTRHGSVSSVSESLPTREDHLQDMLSPQDHQSRYMESMNYQSNDHAASYFGGTAPSARAADIYAPPSYPMSVYQSYAMNAQYGQGRPSSPHRSMYGVLQPRQNQLLYIVLFKCSRADVFYVQEGTGLSVKPGDLVIVEADRGTDLGTVAQENVDWAQAKELKEHYAEEHYKWLMMYSQGAAVTSDGTGAGLMAASNGLQGSAVGGMGPPSQHGMQEPASGELKPKIIKRLAQTYEIQALRDKEGNEAKAKRVCMQKVKEHGLHMEILDAEFQVDWKKLTFYYFADAYINFNSLVTDLFKVYKTRIWMSAINPASFASPSLGLQAPSGIGPGAVGISRPSQGERRIQQPQEQPSYGVNTQAGRVYLGGSFAEASERNHVPAVPYQQPGYAYGYSPFAAPRTSTTPAAVYASNGIQNADPFSQFQATVDYQQTMPPGFLPSHAATTSHSGGEYGKQGNVHPPANDAWINAVQALSLNSR